MPHYFSEERFLDRLDHLKSAHANHHHAKHNLYDAEDSGNQHKINTCEKHLKERTATLLARAKASLMDLAHLVLVLEHPDAELSENTPING